MVNFTVGEHVCYNEMNIWLSAPTEDDNRLVRVDQILVDSKTGVKSYRCVAADVPEKIEAIFDDEGFLICDDIGKLKVIAWISRSHGELNDDIELPSITSVKLKPYQQAPVPNQVDFVFRDNEEEVPEKTRHGVMLSASALAEMNAEIDKIYSAIGCVGMHIKTN